MESRQTRLLEFTQNCGKVTLPTLRVQECRGFEQLCSTLAFIQEKCSHFILVVFICTKITSEVIPLSPINFSRNMTMLAVKEASGHII